MCWFDYCVSVVDVRFSLAEVYHAGRRLFPLGSAPVGACVILNLAALKDVDSSQLISITQEGSVWALVEHRPIPSTWIATLGRFLSTLGLFLVVPSVGSNGARRAINTKS